MRARLNQIEEERKQLLAKAQEDALKETENLRAEVRRLRARIVAAGGSLAEVKAIEKEAEQAADTAAQSRAESLISSLQAPPPKRTLKAGDTVRVKSLNTTAEVNEIIGGEADVQVGRMRMRVKLSDLERIRGAQPLVEKQESVTFAEKPISPGMELDLRGMTVEEGVSLVEDYVDRAARAALPFARIIHGKGTGVLRQAVRNALKAHPFVKSFETGQDGEGGDGVTVVKFKE
ncbi:MAG: hypothetical protein HC853_03265 [Anaerolineae bacterium]|nr:hypothetical protein [Anaerolineae bacterium]